jgi:hypothetical protein
MNFIPPLAEKLLTLAKSGNFPVPLNCQIHTGSEDWQSYANAMVFGEMVGIQVHTVQGAGHALPHLYVTDLLLRWRS